VSSVKLKELTLSARVHSLHTEKRKNLPNLNLSLNKKSKITQKLRSISELANLFFFKVCN
jgi:hypothetical protein